MIICIQENISFYTSGHPNILQFNKCKELNLKPFHNLKTGFFFFSQKSEKKRFQFLSISNYTVFKIEFILLTYDGTQRKSEWYPVMHSVSCYIITVNRDVISIFSPCNREHRRLFAMTCLQTAHGVIAWLSRRLM